MARRGQLPKLGEIEDYSTMDGKRKREWGTSDPDHATLREGKRQQRNGG